MGWYEYIIELPAVPQKWFGSADGFVQGTSLEAVAQQPPPALPHDVDFFLCHPQIIFVTFNENIASFIF